MIDDNEHSKIANAFTIISKIVLITIILVFVLEGISFVGYSIFQPIISDMKINQQISNNDIYAHQEWSKEYLKEVDQINFQYYPYLGFQRAPDFHGKYVNINNESIRATWNSPTADTRNTSVKIFCFGGSTMWGTGARDNFTIPSQLSKELYKSGYSAEVTNFGEGAYVSTQDLIKLELELKKGNIPDIVIFYDGYNDGASAYQDRIAGYPQNIEKRKLEYNKYEFNTYQRTNPLEIFRTINGVSYTMKGVRQLLTVFPIINLNKNAHELTNEEFSNLTKATSESYFENIRITHALEQEYGFQSYFFIQPTIYSKKHLSPAETKIFDPTKRDPQDEFLDEFYSITKTRIDSSNSSRVYYLGDVFGDSNSTMYIDAVHISEDGNQIVANAIMDKILVK